LCEVKCEGIASYAFVVARPDSACGRPFFLLVFAAIGGREAEIVAIHGAWSSMRYERKAMAARAPSADISWGEVGFYRVGQRRLMNCHGSEFASGSEELTNFGR
jgi:hypothetical protein